MQLCFYTLIHNLKREEFSLDGWSLYNFEAEYARQVHIHSHLDTCNY